MCWKKKPQEITSNRVALLFGINDYPGSGNDLRGCINDIEDVTKKLKSEFPDFQIFKFKDSEVTTGRFMSEIENVLLKMKQGHLYIHYSGHGTQIPSVTEPNGYNESLYLHNGPLIDDEIYRLQMMTPVGLRVTAKFDSCFSGGMGSRNMNPHYLKSRFMPLQGVPVLSKAVNHLGNTDSGQVWLIYSGCGEEQTSADAMFSGRANGAFTYFDLQSYNPGTVNADAYSRGSYLIQKYGFDQRPELSGPDYRKNELVYMT